jgi:prephenate dehydrogenase
MFDKVAIVGPGLIGASIGMALRRNGLARWVVGIGRRMVSLDKALEVGAVDHVTLDMKAGVQDVELVILATPIGSLEELACRAAPLLRPETVITDVASTKVKVIEAVTSALRGRPDVAYIPTHPMAGSERSGPLAASPTLFSGSVCIITPLTNTLPDAKSRITRMWNALGARAVSMSPQSHDALVARISHLPHLAAAALLAVVDGPDTEFCGKGLIDTTRVASGSPALWIDICKTNREQIRAAIADYVSKLQDIADSLEFGHLGRLRAMLEDSKSKRDRLLSARQAASQAEAQ